MSSPQPPYDPNQVPGGTPGGVPGQPSYPAQPGYPAQPEGGQPTTPYPTAPYPTTPYPGAPAPYAPGFPPPAKKRGPGGVPVPAWIAGIVVIIAVIVVVVVLTTNGSKSNNTANNNPLPTTSATSTSTSTASVPTGAATGSGTEAPGGAGSCGPLAAQLEQFGTKIENDGNSDDLKAMKSDTDALVQILNNAADQASGKEQTDLHKLADDFTQMSAAITSLDVNKLTSLETQVATDAQAVADDCGIQASF